MEHVSPPCLPETRAPAALAAADAGRVRGALSSTLAENTRHAYLSHWLSFCGWSERNRYAPAPVPAKTVGAHLAAVAETASASNLKVRRHGDPLHAPGDGEEGGRSKVPQGSAGPVRLIRPRPCRTKCLPSSPGRVQPLDANCYFKPRIGLTLAQSLGIDCHRSGLVALTIGDG